MSERHCIHYGRKDGEPDCALGIDIRQNFRPRYPCWTGNKPPESSAMCPQFMAPTPEQLAEAARKGNDAVARMFAGIAAVEQWEKAHGVVLNKVIAISCPCCTMEDALRFVRSKRHLVAKCDTPNCVEFRGSRGR